MIPENEHTATEQAEEPTIQPQEDATSVEEIEIEEMAIDGICGVY